jgi:hypothetical protein
MRHISILISLLLISLTGYSQTTKDIFQRLADDSPSEGTVRIIQEPGVADMVKQHIEQNKKSPGIDGFRIQLYSGSGTSSRKEAEDVKSRMMSAFPNQKVYLTYNAPFWRVRAGNYRNKSESMQLFSQLRGIFPNCYPVKDNTIKFSDL